MSESRGGAPKPNGKPKKKNSGKPSGGAEAEHNWKPSFNPWLIAVSVTLAAFMEILDTTIVNVALPHIAGSLAASNDEATYALTAYLTANGIVLTVSGWMSDTFGRKRYFLVCLAMFTVFSFLCGIATSLGQLIIFRAFQGFFGGGLQPNQQSIILDTFPPEKRGAAFGLTAVATIVAPVLGPTLGGWITDTYTWRWIFFVNVPVGIFAVIVNYILVEDPPWEKAKQKRKTRGIDYIGLSLITVGLGCMQVMVDKGEDWDWFGSPIIRTLAVLAFLGIGGAIVWMLTAKKPIVNLDIFKDKNFALGCIFIGAMGAILYASSVIIPQFAQSELGYTATISGLILSPGGIVVIILIPIVGQLMNRIQTRWIVMFGFFLMGCALFYSAGLVPNIDFKTLVYMRSAQDGGARLLVRADLDDRLSDLADALPQRRCRDLFDVPQRLRLYRHLALECDGDGAHAGRSGQPVEVHDAAACGLQRVRQPGAGELADTGPGVEHAEQRSHRAALSDIFETGGDFSLRKRLHVRFGDCFFGRAVLFSDLQENSFWRRRLAVTNMVRKRHLGLVCVAVSALTGCVGPDFAPPVPLTAESRNFLDTGKPVAAPVNVLAGASGAPTDVRWWHGFHDKELSKLESRVADENLDVRTATLRLAESRAQRASTASAALPTLSGTANDYREAFSKNAALAIIPPSSFSGLGSGSSSQGLQQGFQHIENGFNVYSVGFDASWELDLWGHVARQIEAADAQLAANAEMRRDTLVSSLAEVASDYVNLRGTQAQIKIAKDNIKVDEEILNVTKVRMEKGLVTQSRCRDVGGAGRIGEGAGPAARGAGALRHQRHQPAARRAAARPVERADRTASDTAEPAAHPHRAAVRVGAAPAGHPHGRGQPARRHRQHRRRRGRILPEREPQREPDPAGVGAARHLQGLVPAVHEHRVPTSRCRSSRAASSRPTSSSRRRRSRNRPSPITRRCFRPGTTSSIH